MKNLVLPILLAFCPFAFAQDEVPEAQDSPNSLEDLIETVREGSSVRRALLAEREARFLEARDQQQTLLDEAAALRQSEEAEADRLRALYEQGEDELAALEDQLAEQSGDLTDVFSVVGQVAGDALPMVQNSLVSAQVEGRLPLLEKLSVAETVPSSGELRALWLLLLEEMNFSGQVARFDADVITAGGEEARQQVTRIGTFTALSEGKYLRYLPESGRLLALARQPLGVSGTSLEEFESAIAPLVDVSIDPSSGSILSLITQTPEFSERIRQGGVIGYVILAIGAIGLMIGLQRFVAVMLASRRAGKLADNDREDGDHPIQQLRAVAHNPDYLADVDAMSAKMDEIVTMAAQQLRRGLSTLSIFAAVSPLLGLLGTVTGMIETFQVITLFGAGDPRLMSGGISQALITTQLGLAVAIPLLLIHSFIQGRANNLITELDETAADLFARGRSEDRHHAA